MCPNGLYFTGFERNFRAELLLQLSFGAESKKHSRPRAKSQCNLQFYHSPRSRRLREGDTRGVSYLSPRVSPSRAPVFSGAHYFQAPATQANFIMGSDQTE